MKSVLRVTLIAALLSLASTPSAFGAPNPGIPPFQSLPTLTALNGFLTAASTVATTPNLQTTEPSLAQIATIGDVLPNVSQHCQEVSPSAPLNVAKTLSTCSFGDTRAKRTILLYGDSQARQWLAALNEYGMARAWRIVMVAHSSCSPWINPFSVDNNGHSIVACNQTRTRELAFANALHPQVIIAAGLAYSWGAGKNAHSDQVTSEVNATARALAPSHARYIVLTGLPNWDSVYSSAGSQAPESCLTVHSTDLLGCLPNLNSSLHFSSALNPAVHVISVTPLFCASTTCPLFATAPGGTHLIYFDANHMNYWYSSWIGRAFGQLLSPDLPH